MWFVSTEYSGMIVEKCCKKIKVMEVVLTRFSYHYQLLSQLAVLCLPYQQFTIPATSVLILCEDLSEKISHLLPPQCHLQN